MKKVDTVEQMVLPRNIVGHTSMLCDAKGGTFIIVPHKDRKIYFVAYYAQMAVFFPVLTDGTVMLEGDACGITGCRFNDLIEEFTADMIPGIKIVDNKIVQATT
jgi:hypothetical protein